MASAFLHYLWFSCSITFDKKRGKKEVAFPSGWASITADDSGKHHDESKNGYCILTGQKNKLIVIDADEVAAIEGGDPIPTHILAELETQSSAVVKTPNGRHFYFNTERGYKSSTGICWNSVAVPHLDIWGDGGCIIAPPSSYKRNGNLVRYAWMKGGLDTVGELPQSIVDALVIEAKPEVALQEYVESDQHDIIVDLLNALPAKLWDGYDSWLQLGIILFNSGEDVDTWDAFSKQSSHYSASGCREKWRSFKRGNLGINSLWRLVKLHNPDEFARLQKKHINIAALLDQTHVSLAKLFHLLHPDDYALCSVTGWYERMTNNVWLSRGKEVPPSMLLSVSDTIKRECDVEINSCLYRMSQMTNDGTEEEKSLRTSLTERCKNYLKIKMSAGNHGFLNSIQKVLASHYIVEEFYRRLDEERNLYAFDNGVVELDTGIFRDISPDDYISTTCGYNYPRVAVESARGEVMAFFRSIFASEEDVDYYLKILSYMLTGNKKFQEFYILRGQGANGKGLTINMMGHVMGKYMKNLPTSYFTQPSEGKGAPLPELAACKAARFVWASEPDDKANLQSNFVKMLSGNEEITCRSLYSKEITFLPQFAVCILANTVPKLSRLDLAVKRRFRIIPFPYQFVDHPISENHRAVDRSLEERLKTPEWRDALITILLERFHRDVRAATMFSVPAEVRGATQEYMDDNNPLINWLPQYIDTTAPATERMKASDILTVYKNTGGEKDMTAVRIGTLLSAMGFHSVKTNGTTCYKGFIIKPL